MARILIIDDEESIGEALRQVFEYEGHRVHLCGNGPRRSDRTIRISSPT